MLWCCSTNAEQPPRQGPANVSPVCRQNQTPLHMTAKGAEHKERSHASGQVPWCSVRHPTNTRVLTQALCVLWKEALRRKMLSVHIQKYDSWFIDSSGECRFALGNHTVSFFLCHCFCRNIQHLLGHVHKSLWCSAAGTAFFFVYKWLKSSGEQEELVFSIAKWPLQVDVTWMWKITGSATRGQREGQGIHAAMRSWMRWLQKKRGKRQRDKAGRLSSAELQHWSLQRCKACLWSNTGGILVVAKPPTN